MLRVLFFATLFSSLSWTAYALLYIHGQLAGADLSSVSAERLALYIGLVVLPAWAMWQIFGLINHYIKDSNFNLRLNQLFNQMKKNQDYTDLVVRVMLDAEHEIKDGFVINKFDVFIADMNELLADIVLRCNAASSLQLEQLWARVKNGERWTIGKTLIEAAKNYDDFSAYLAEKARKDSVFKGTLLEFCARYQNLNALLEKHDRDRVFITIVETGVMGKVYSILAPAADALENVAPEQSPQPDADEKTFEVSPNILTMEAPQNDDEKVSFLSRLNPFKKKKKSEDEISETEQQSDEAFFTALQKSLNSPEETHKNYTQNYVAEDEDIQDESQATHYEGRLFTETKIKMSENNAEAVQSGKVYDVPFINENKNSAGVPENSYMSVSSDEGKPSVRTENPQNNDFAYPFGGWMNEENYKK